MSALRNVGTSAQVQTICNAVPERLETYQADAFCILTRDECVGIAAWLGFIVFMLDMCGLLGR